MRAVSIAPSPWLGLASWVPAAQSPGPRPRRAPALDLAVLQLKVSELLHVIGVGLDDPGSDVGILKPLSDAPDGGFQLVSHVFVVRFNVLRSHGVPRLSHGEVMRRLWIMGNKS